MLTRHIGLVAFQPMVISKRLFDQPPYVPKLGILVVFPLKTSKKGTLKQQDAHMEGAVDGPPPRLLSLGV